MEELADPTRYKPTVVLTGAAKDGRSGSLNPVEIRTRETVYRFRVSLPCIQNGTLKLDLCSDGKVDTQDRMNSGEVSVEQSPIRCKKRLRLFWPPGLFSISFSLPGLVEPRFSVYAMIDGGIECIVLRSGLQNDIRAELIQVFEAA